MKAHPYLHFAGGRNQLRVLLVHLLELRGNLGSPLNYLLALVLKVRVHLRLDQRVGKILKSTRSRNYKY